MPSCYAVGAKKALIYRAYRTQNRGSKEKIPYPSKSAFYCATNLKQRSDEAMAVFRVERNTGYTVMSNHHLRNKELSLFRVGTSCIFCSMNARSSSVTLNLICTVRFLPFIGSHSFPFRGFGTLPNKQFSTDAPQRRRAKIRKGYPFPMLAKKLSPFIPTTWKI